MMKAFTALTIATLAVAAFAETDLEWEYCSGVDSFIDVHSIYVGRNESEGTPIERGKTNTVHVTGQTLRNMAVARTQLQAFHEDETTPRLDVPFPFAGYFKKGPFEVRAPVPIPGQAPTDRYTTKIHVYNIRGAEVGCYEIHFRMH